MLRMALKARLALHLAGVFGASPVLGMVFAQHALAVLVVLSPRTVHQRPGAWASEHTCRRDAVYLRLGVVAVGLAGEDYYQLVAVVIEQAESIAAVRAVVVAGNDVRPKGMGRVEGRPGAGLSFVTVYDALPTQIEAS